VGALAIRSCIKGAYLNVKINSAGLNDKEFVKMVVERGAEIETQAEQNEKMILELINDKIVL
jgi:glutamate formiminotransferase/formiminotetrahydrofolate cyclodeaminase